MYSDPRNNRWHWLREEIKNTAGMVLCMGFGFGLAAACISYILAEPVKTVVAPAEVVSVPIPVPEPAYGVVVQDEQWMPVTTRREIRAAVHVFDALKRKAELLDAENKKMAAQLAKAKEELAMFKQGLQH